VGDEPLARRADNTDEPLARRADNTDEPLARRADNGVEQHRLILLRHGETEWSRSGQHTGRTELDLTETGREQAKLAADALATLDLRNPMVVSSPRQRALDTAELAGLTVDEVSPLLSEWDYGDYEGLTTQQIRQQVPDWLVWTHGCPGGESVSQVSDRADRAIAFALEQMVSRDVLFVGHGHFSRAVLTRWAELPICDGIRFAMVAASIAVCGHEHGVRQISALGLAGHRHPCLPT
jgi:probable phosphoglycerate mutase